MMKKFKNLFLSLIFAISLALTTFLVGCGATPSSTITGIKFDTMKYDAETGFAVFEVDKGITTDLTYKIYPSSGSGSKIYFDPIDKGTAENSSRYTFKDGKITISSNDFEDVKYKVRVEEFTDTCIIRLKQYPVEISPSAATVNLSTNETYAINVVGKFVSSLGVVSYKNITENDYDFKVETSDETIIDVPNPSRLKFCAVRDGTASAKVTVTLIDKDTENVDMKFEINVNIIQNTQDAFVIVSGYDKFAKDNSKIDIDYNALNLEGGLKAIKFEVFLLNSSNVLIEDDIDYSIQFSSTKFASLSSDKKYILINGSVENNYVLKVKLCTDLTMKDGSLFSIDLELKIVK